MIKQENLEYLKDVNGNATQLPEVDISNDIKSEQIADIRQKNINEKLVESVLSELVTNTEKELALRIVNVFGENNICIHRANQVLEACSKLLLCSTVNHFAEKVATKSNRPKDPFKIHQQ